MRALALVVGGVEAALLVPALTQVADPGGVWPVLLFLGATLAVGTLLAWRVSRNPIGWLLLAAAGFFLLQPPLVAAAEDMLDTRPQLAAWLLWFAADREDGWNWFPPLWVLFTQVILLFPDGRLPSSRWRPFWWFTIGVLVYGVTVLSMLQTEVAPGIDSPAGVFDNDNPLLGLALLGLLISVLGSAWSLVWRYRTASMVTREQIKWVALAGVVVILVYAISLGGTILRDTVDWTFIAITYSLIPLSIGVAVLKYRLYDIDRIVSRTISYGLVSLFVVGTYAVVVTSVSRLLPDSGALPVAGATLAAAAVFLPVLRHIRAAVDRRFDRAAFDAQVEVEGFADRMGSATDAGGVADDLTETVRRTLVPSAVGVWVGVWVGGDR